MADNFSAVDGTILRLTDVSSGLTIAATTYTAGDQLGAAQTVSSALVGSSFSGYLRGVVCVDDADVIDLTSGIDLMFWYDTVTLASDNAAFSVSAADWQKWVAKVSLTGWTDYGSFRAVTWSGEVPLVSVDSTLRYSMISGANHSFFAAADDLNFSFIIEQAV